MSEALQTKVAMTTAQLSAIKPYWNNPRKNDEAVEALKKSIKEFSFLVPIVVDAEGVIITGHTRYKASVELGLTEVPVIYAAHLSPEQAKAFRLADNRISENSKWDETKLAEELRALQDLGFDMEGTGFSKEELDCLCGTITADCLGDMDFASVCGTVAPKSSTVRDSVVISVGNYRFYVGVQDYKLWEAQMLSKFPKRLDLVNELIGRLGFVAQPAKKVEEADKAEGQA